MNGQLAPEAAAPCVTPRDRIRRHAYLIRLSWAMRDYPSRPYRQLSKDLEAEIDAAITDVGTVQALRDLGRPERLAARYMSELNQPRPRWLDGAILGGLLGFFIPALCILTYVLGAANALTDTGGGTATVSFLGATFTVTGTAREVSASGTFGWATLLALAVVYAIASSIGSRIWRLRSPMTASNE